jgi:4-hydroxybenzoate polyprenyltransferase
MTAQATRKATRKAPRAPGQIRSLLRAVHPRQALAFAVVVGTLVALTGRPGREIALSAVTVFVAQLILGLLNDLLDLDRDRMGGAKNKPIAEGIIPPGNASFAIAVLLLLVIPLSLQNGTQAGLYVLATLIVGAVHNRWLHTTALSWLGWAATFALLTFFVTYGGWGHDVDGSAPLATFVVLCAVLGVCVHFLTSLPDLVVDNQAGTKNLPLRVALRTGAPRLLVVAIAVTVVVVAAIVWTTAQAGAIAS